MKKLAISTLILLALSAPALADSAAEIGKSVSDAFDKACGSGNIPEVLALYESDAIVIWPGEGQIAHGKAEIEKLAKDLCKPGAKLKFISQESRALGHDYVINVGRWESQSTGPDGKPVAAEVRTTELLHKRDGKWRYEVDNASIGLPSPPPAAAPESAN